ncbi:triphosphoribosyl-dephospho-CoA synthase CitG [Orbaceae bacterium ESL0721]|nr:triphosphoribosyl-dephospho-CoA synthase CitG [Orbaceae bacterium ESL0721]
MDYYNKQAELLSSLQKSLPAYQPAKLALHALIKEICLTPKPGLVDMQNSGAHLDMNFTTFINSIQAITPWLDRFYCYGQNFANNGSQQNGFTTFLADIRPIGMACEASMLKATHNINTHKGGIFALGLILAATGYLTVKTATTELNYQQICNQVAKICQGIVTNELEKQKAANTVGEKLYKNHKLTGARGEAESGYRTVREISLPIYLEMLTKGYDEQSSLLQAMLYLLAYNQDTNLVSRGGLAGLTYVQNSAKTLIAEGGICHHLGVKQLQAFDLALIERNLSPGGSADLIAITWFLAQFQ